MSEDDKRLNMIREIAASLQATGAHAIPEATSPQLRADGGYAGEIRGRDGRRHPVILHPVRGALGLAAVDRIASKLRGTDAPVVVLATIIGKELGAALTGQGLGYLDLAGNCHLDLDGGNLTVHVEGRRSAVRPAGANSVRAAGYRVLFSLLADPLLLELPVRHIGAAARASRHAVHSLIARLRDEGVLMRAGRSKHVYAPGGREKCIDRFCAGWADVLRGSLLAGRFRMREQNPAAIAQRIEQGLHAAKVRFGFGGAHGSSHWLRYLQGGEPVIHVDGWTPELARDLDALPDRQGPMHVFRTMTTLDLASGAADIAHPLLIHAELARSPDPRAREASRLLLDQIAGEAG